MNIHYIENFTTFEQLAFALKNRVLPENFQCIEYVFHIIKAIWATCSCPEKTFALKISLYWISFSHSGVLINWRLPWKTKFPWKFYLHWIYFSHSKFWATSACPENRVFLKIFKPGGAAASPNPPPPTPMGVAYLWIYMHELLLPKLVKVALGGIFVMEFCYTSGNHGSIWEIFCSLSKTTKLVQISIGLPERASKKCSCWKNQLSAWTLVNS